MTLFFEYDYSTFRGNININDKGKRKPLIVKDAKLKEYMNGCFIFESCIGEILKALDDNNLLYDIDFKGTKQDYELLKSILNDEYNNISCNHIEITSEENPFDSYTMGILIQASVITAAAISAKNNELEFNGILDELIAYLDKADIPLYLKVATLYSNCEVFVDSSKLERSFINKFFSKVPENITDGMSFEEIEKLCNSNQSTVETLSKNVLDVTLDYLDNAEYVILKFGLGAFSVIENGIDFFIAGIGKIFRKDFGKKIFENQLSPKMNDSLDNHFQVSGKVKKAGDFAQAIGDILSKLGLSIYSSTGRLISAIVGGSFLGFGVAGEKLKENVKKTGEYGNKEYAASLAIGVVAGALPSIIGKVCGGIGNKFKELSKTAAAAQKTVTSARVASFGVGIAGATTAGAAATAIFEIDQLYEKSILKVLNINDKVEIDLKKVGIDFAIGVGISVLSYLVITGCRLIKTDIDMNAATEQYKKDLINNSEYPDTLEKSKIDVKTMKRVSPEETARLRNEFVKSRPSLRKQWSEINKIDWPVYEEDTWIGKQLFKAGQPYEAHHIQPLSLGGTNTADNITPLNWEKHHLNIHAKNSKLSVMESMKELISTPKYISEMTKYSNQDKIILAAKITKEGIKK